MSDQPHSESAAQKVTPIELTDADRTVVSHRASNVADFVHEAMISDARTKNSSRIDNLAYDLDSSKSYFPDKTDMAIWLTCGLASSREEDRANNMAHQASQINPDGILYREGEDLDAAKNKAVTDAVLKSPEVKAILPEVALLRLQSEFPEIHEMKNPGGITRQEWANYNKSHDLSYNDLGQAAKDYITKNFDAFKALDPTGGDQITWKGIQAGLKDLDNLETQRHDLEIATRGADGLKYLQKNFNTIHTAQIPGISEHEFGAAEGSSRDAGRETFFSMVHLRNNMDAVTKFSTSDDTFLKYVSINADGITRADIEAGLKLAQENPAKIAQLQARLDSWPE